MARSRFCSRLALARPCAFRLRGPPPFLLKTIYHMFALYGAHVARQFISCGVYCVRFPSSCLAVRLPTPRLAVRLRFAKSRAAHGREIDKFPKLLERKSGFQEATARVLQRFPRSPFAVPSPCCHCVPKSSQKLRKLVNFCNPGCMKPWKQPRRQSLCFKYEKTSAFQRRSAGETLRKIYH